MNAPKVNRSVWQGSCERLVSG